MEGAAFFPVDRRLHAVCRGLLSLLAAMAGVVLALWIAEIWAAGGPGERDATWWASLAIRIAAFAAMIALSTLAGIRSQPRPAVDGARARPGRSAVRLRIASAVCAALFFADFAARAFATEDRTWVDVAAAALLAVPVLAAVVAIAAGRALLGLWSEAVPELGDDVPVWSEPSEAEVSRRVPSIGPQTAWLGVFLAAWLLSDRLPPLLPIGERETAISVTVVLEAIAMTAIGAAHFLEREIALAEAVPAGRRAGLDPAKASLGIFLSVDLGVRTLAVPGLLGDLEFAIGCALSVLGFAAGAWALLRRSPPRSSD